VHEGDAGSAGSWREYEGGIADWKAQAARAATAASSTAKAAQKMAAKEPTAHSNAAPTAQKQSGKKLSYKDKQLLEKLPAEINALELEQADIHLKLSKPDGYKNDVGALQAAMRRMEDIERLLDEKLTLWAELEG
jgi:ATP-binding cassette subfamily F protein uup